MSCSRDCGGCSLQTGPAVVTAATASWLARKTSITSQSVCFSSAYQSHGGAAVSATPLRPTAMNCLTRNTCTIEALAVTAGRRSIGWWISEWGGSDINAEKSCVFLEPQGETAIAASAELAAAIDAEHRRLTTTELHSAVRRLWLDLSSQTFCSI